MKIERIRVMNLRSIVDAELDFGPITLLVGKNNVGKSTILRAMNAIQEGGQLSPKDVRAGQSSAKVVLNLTEVDAQAHWGRQLPPAPSAQVDFEVNRSTGQSAMMLRAPVTFGEVSVDPISTQTQRSFIVPFLSMRKAVTYSEAINETQGLSIMPNFSNLVARVDMLMDQYHPEHGIFVD